MRIKYRLILSPLHESQLQHHLVYITGKRVNTFTHVVRYKPSASLPTGKSLLPSPLISTTLPYKKHVFHL